jgi:hypothetical protein
MKKSFWLCLLFCACSDPCYNDECTVSIYQVDTDYTFNGVVQNGLLVDVDGQEIDVDRLGFIVSQVFYRLEKAFPDFVLPSETRQQAQCDDLLPIIKSYRSAKHCLRFMFPSSWEVSKLDPNEQVLKDKAPEMRCIEKGLPRGDCRWRALYTQDGMVVSTPNMRLIPDVLVRWATSCNDLYSDPILATCAKPL